MAHFLKHFLRFCAYFHQKAPLLRQSKGKNIVKHAYFWHYFSIIIIIFSFKISKIIFYHFYWYTVSISQISKIDYDIFKVFGAIMRTMNGKHSRYGSQQKMAPLKASFPQIYWKFHINLMNISFKVALFMKNDFLIFFGAKFWLNDFHGALFCIMEYFDDLILWKYATFCSTKRDIFCK